MNVGRCLVLALAVFLLVGLPRSLAQEQNLALHHVRKIHVGTMGQGDDAERFRLLLEKELRRVGFEIAAKAEDADAILTSAHSVEISGDKAFARATVALKTRSGKQIWSGAYSGAWRSPFRGDGDRDSELMPITIPS